MEYAMFHIPEHKFPRNTKKREKLFTIEYKNSKGTVGSFFQR